MNVTVITPTGNRPEAFALCREYMERQTRQPDQWIVVDDGDEQIKNPTGFNYIRRQGGEDEHTLRFNLQEALTKVTGDMVLIMEDDDWYHRDYIQIMERHYEQGTAWGQSTALYYDVERRVFLGREFPANFCLCQVGFCSTLIPFVLGICKEPGFLIDTKIARHPHARFLKWEELLCVGIKCLPGRDGLSLGWRMGAKAYDDFEMELLKDNIGKDYKNYEQYYQKESRGS